MVQPLSQIEDEGRGQKRKIAPARVMQTGELKTKAIVTRATPYGESDLIVTLVGVDGKITATVRGCLKKGAKLRYAASPMNFGEYVLSGRNNKYVVTECSQIESFDEVTRDIDRYYAAFLTLETLTKLSEEDGMLALTLKALDELAHSDRDADDIVRDFLLMTLALGGNTLNFGVCNVCGQLLEDEAYFKESDGIVCKHCRGFGAIAIDSTSRKYLNGEMYYGDGSEENNSESDQGSDRDGEGHQNIPSPSQSILIGHHALKVRANRLLGDLIYNMLGVKLTAQYFVESL